MYFCTVFYTLFDTDNLIIFFTDRGGGLFQAELPDHIGRNNHSLFTIHFLTHRLARIKHRTKTTLRTPKRAVAFLLLVSLVSFDRFSQGVNSNHPLAIYFLIRKTNL